MRQTEVLSKLSDVISSPILLAASAQYACALRTPQHFVEMLFLVEDKRFPVHLGIDPVAVTRALVFNLAGGTLQGGSTIVQQVYNIRRLQVTGRLPKRTITHKVCQAGWALIHSILASRTSILVEYVENVYWGRSYTGIDRAAQGYFETTRGNLSLAQSFFLAERIASPNRISAKRIATLLSRWAISANLRRGGVPIREVIQVYNSVYGCGGELWQMLGK